MRLFLLRKHTALLRFASGFVREVPEYGIAALFAKRTTFSWGVRLLRPIKCCNPWIAALYKTMHFQELRGTCKEDGALSRIMTRLREKTPHFRERRCTCENDGALLGLQRTRHIVARPSKWHTVGESDAHMPRFQVRLWHFCCILFDRTVHVIYIYSMHRMHIYVFAARSRPCHRDAVCLAGFVLSFLHRLWEL